MTERPWFDGSGFEGVDANSAVNKLLILYLINKMDIPMSQTQVSQFVLEEEYMDYFMLQQMLTENVEKNYLEAVKENNETRYTVTDEGITLLDYFDRQIPINIRNRITKYVAENRKDFKRDYEITANYFYGNDMNDFIVKCGLYEDEVVLMEINLSVVSKEQAKFICNNWKANVSTIYGNILTALIQKDDASDDEAPGENRNETMPS